MAAVIALVAVGVFVFLSERRINTESEAMDGEFSAEMIERDRENLVIQLEGSKFAVERFERERNEWVKKRVPSEWKKYDAKIEKAEKEVEKYERLLRNHDRIHSR